MFEQSNSIADILNLPADKCAAELKHRCDESGELELLAELGEKFGNTPSPAVIAKLVNFVKTHYPQTPRPIRTVGIYYWHMTIGGVQRVITSQFPVFKELGVKIVFFTDALPEPGEYPLPDYVKRVWIPAPDATKPDFRERLAECAEIIKAEKVDVFYNHYAVSEKCLLWQSLLVKTVVQIPYFTHFHSLFCSIIDTSKGGAFVRATNLLQMSDLCMALSETNRLFFTANGINSVYMPNQYFLPDTKISPKECSAGHTILFLARIDFSHKRPLDAVKVIEYVIKELPDAKLLIVGGGSEPNEKRLKEAIRNSPAANNIEFCGPTMDVASYYRRADVFLVTSKLDGFPVTLLESQAFGLPVVCYDMPYLDIIRHPDNGIITVPQEEPGAAAEAIIKVLTDPELYRTKSRNGVATAQYFAEYDLTGLWQQILTDWGAVLPKEAAPEQLEILLKTLQQNIYWSHVQQQQQLNSVKSQLQKAQHKNRSLCNSFSYRLGRALTWMPRKIRGGVKCLKQHGVVYTCKRIIQKIDNLFK